MFENSRILYSVNKRQVYLYFIIFLHSLWPIQSFAEETSVIRFGVLSVGQPSRVHFIWLPFADYMSQQLRHSVELVTFQDFGALIVRNAIANPSHLH